MLRSFTFKLLIRLIFILLNMVVLSIIFGDMRLFFNQIILFVVLVLQVADLIRFINYTNKELAKFLLAVKHDDITISFQKSKLGKSFRELHEGFAGVIDAIKNAKIEKEAQFQYLRLAVNRVNIGIISIENKDNVVLFNTAAESVLDIKGVNNVQILREKVPQFINEVNEIGDEGRKLIEIQLKGETKTLSVDVKPMIMLDKTYKHITFQDIRGEIEQKEIEAWHKLIRILTHEIMNSITPISSLTETMQSMLEKDRKQISLQDLNEETIHDLRFSLKTVQKRSDGMLAFVDDYRKLTKVGNPVLEKVSVHELFNQISQLLSTELQNHQISLTSFCSPNTLTIDMDIHLVEQVLINMITNSRHALKEKKGAYIHLKAYQDMFSVIEVSDNGCGINEKELKEIFVPFFSTKKEGSGIGLSLSKQIMHLHGGNIKVESTVGEGTTFKLNFKKSPGTK